MKTILAMVTGVLIGTSAYAQTAGTTQMFEFNADSVLQGLFSLDKSKTRGSDSDNRENLRLNLNYAYSLATMPRLQLGARGNYDTGTQAGRGDFEDYGLQVGAIFNNMEDLTNSCYASIYLGMNWANTLSTGGSRDEVMLTTFAVGKRFALDRWGIKHLTYTPEVAFQNRNSTTDSSLEYSQSLQFRFLQFSVFF